MMDSLAVSHNIAWSLPIVTRRAKRSQACDIQGVPFQDASALVFHFHLLTLFRSSSHLTNDFSSTAKLKGVLMDCFQLSITG
jgi:hypothetical protein